MICDYMRQSNTTQKHFQKDLEGVRFKFNPYDPCVANQLVKKKHQTIRFHVDDIMSSHVDTAVNDKFLIWMNKKYGKHAPMKATQGSIHDYLGMTFDFSKKGEVTVDMCKYMGKMWQDFAEKYKLKSTAPTTATDELFKTDESTKLKQEWKEDFHTYVARGLFASKRGRPDTCLLYTSPSPRDQRGSRMPSSA